MHKHVADLLPALEEARVLSVVKGMWVFKFFS
jgi:hypothetical protein